jgi:hypothetical protein
MRFRPVSSLKASIAASFFLSALTAPLIAQPHTTLGGYGEVHYVNSNRPGVGSVGTVKRFVLYFAHSFDDRITFRSELEVEDAKVEGGDEGGEVALEQAYLDFRLGDHATVRAGLVLIPLGILNETHEPPTFNGVARADYHSVVIPTTWRELGVGIVGAIPGAEGLAYRFYLVNGLLAEGFSAERGVRGGRQEGKEASFANPSLTGRLEYARPGLKIGGAFYHGGTGNGDPRFGDGIFAAPVTMVAADARFERGPWSLRGEAAFTHVAKAEEISAAFGENVASRIGGWYGEGAYNLLHLVGPATTARLDAFVRYERLNTQSGVPDAMTANDAFARRITTLGLTWKPISNVAIKGDFQFRRNKAGTAEDEVVRLGLGYQF